MKELLIKFKECEDNIRKNKIVVVANVRNKTGNYKDYTLKMANENEFFSLDEFHEITDGIRQLELFTKVYYNELMFVDEILTKRYDPNNIIVVNFARNGITEGKKSFVPCFCDLLNIKYTGSDAAVQSLCRNKYVWSCVLQQNSIPVPKTFLYTCYEDLDDIKLKLKKNEEYIIKPVSESSSMGVTTAMEKEKVISFLNDNRNKYIVQAFLSGGEYEVPFFELDGQIYPLPPQKINYKGTILDENLSVLNDYFYSPSDLSVQLNNFLLRTAIKTAKCLNIKKYGRIDFKLDQSGNAFVIDIATLPYITKISSFSAAMEQLGLDYSYIFKFLLTVTYLSGD